MLISILMVIFSKFFIILIFLGKLGIKIWGGVLGQKQPENNLF